MSPLLENAIKSVQVGVQDFASGKPDRALSAVRSLHAGILLLFKEALRRLSPPDSEDVLIKERVLPKMVNGTLTLVGQGKRTVTPEQTRERFEALGIQAEWPRVERVTKVRNDIEHHYTTANAKVLNGVIADSFVVVRNFMAASLKLDPAVALGDETWSTMLKVSEVVEVERKACVDAIEAADWRSDTLLAAATELPCGTCGALLLMPTSDDSPSMKCRACGETEHHEDFVERALTEHLAGESFSAVKDGESPPLIECPFCGRHAYVIDEGRCSVCHESCETECLRCGMEIPVEELSDGKLCGWCAHMSSKDD